MLGSPKGLHHELERATSAGRHLTGRFRSENAPGYHPSPPTCPPGSSIEQSSAAPSDREAGFPPSTPSGTWRRTTGRSACSRGVPRGAASVHKLSMTHELGTFTWLSSK